MLFGVRGAAQRDDRYHMISIIYLVELADKDQKPQAADDAASADWYDLREMLAKP